MSAVRGPTKLVIVLGSGGVGKTTTAASIALALGAKGLRCAVITVDPAKRLAQALGLEVLSNDPQLIQEFPGGGSTHALWLDTKGAFEDLVRRFGENSAAIQKVLEHRLFKIIQTQLGGIEEYLGVEKVLALGQSGRFDVCILDTPPSRHALDFLESPRHLLRFFDEGVLKYFLSDASPENKKSLFERIIKTGRSQAIELFKNFLGKGFLGELAELLESLRPVKQALMRSAEDIENWVHSKECSTLLVSLLEPYPLDEARILSLELEARGLPQPAALVLNKCLPSTFPAELQGSSLYQRFLMQQELRNSLKSSNWAPKRLQEIACYSILKLDRKQLLEMGTLITHNWWMK